jgi:hypothetical protein
MDIRQDPNAIPNYNAGGRVGEPQRNEPEQAQSSVELDASAGGDGAVSGAAENDAHESLLDDGGGVEPAPGQVNGAGAGPTARGNVPGAAGQDASRTGGGAIDGLVGAP